MVDFLLSADPEVSARSSADIERLRQKEAKLRERGFHGANLVKCMRQSVAQQGKQSWNAGIAHTEGV